MNRDELIEKVSGSLYGNFATMESDTADAFAEVAVDAMLDAFIAETMKTDALVYFDGRQQWLSYYLQSLKTQP